MADLASNPAPKGNTHNETARALCQGSTASTPRWVKVFGTVMVALVLLFVALHLTGHGFGSHTPVPGGARQL
jgi:hypothetical protein